MPPPSVIALHITGGMVVLFKTAAVHKNTPEGIGRPIVITPVTFRYAHIDFKDIILKI